MNFPQNITIFTFSEIPKAEKGRRKSVWQSDIVTEEEFLSLANKNYASRQLGFAAVISTLKLSCLNSRLNNYFNGCFFLYCIHTDCQGKLYLEDHAKTVTFYWTDELPLQLFRTNSQWFLGAEDLKSEVQDFLDSW